MARSVKKVFEDALHLPDDARGALVRDLLDSFGAPSEPVDPSDGTWLAEIERRGRAALAGEPGLPWEDVRADIRRRFAGG
jgi:putative addiction module component (TIGR02574 family)